MPVASVERQLWVVIPAYQEASIIAETVASVKSRYENVLVVDDGSDDRTAKVASAAGAVVIRHPINLGQGAALQTGITYALSRGARYIATFDADGQHLVDDLDAMLMELTGKACDVVLGSRFIGRTESLPFARRFTLRAAIVFTNLTCGTRLTDTHNGLRLLTAHAARHISLRQNGMAHASEIIEQIARHRLTYCEVPVSVIYTDYSLRKGQTSWNAFRIIRDLLLGWMSR